MSENFRGAGRFYGGINNASKYFRAPLNIFGAHYKTYGEFLIFPGSVENLRAPRYNFRGRFNYFGEYKNYV